MPKKNKFKINTKSSQKYLWIVDWAKENKKSAILSIILLLIVMNFLAVYLRQKFEKRWN